MVATASRWSRIWQGRGFRNLRRWTRGVDTELFHPRDKSFLDLPRPIHLYVGRVAVEKNIEAFLKLDLPGSKIVVGGGPQLAELKRRYPEVHFAGPREGEDLARHYAAADVFVFPSRTDTFGLVLLEALASGLPVAAFPVPGPLDVINGSAVGFLDEDLASAARHALAISPPGLPRLSRCNSPGGARPSSSWATSSPSIRRSTNRRDSRLSLVGPDLITAEMPGPSALLLLGGLADMDSPTATTILVMLGLVPRLSGWSFSSIGGPFDRY